MSHVGGPRSEIARIASAVASPIAISSWALGRFPGDSPMIGEFADESSLAVGGELTKTGKSLVMESGRGRVARDAV